MNTTTGFCCKNNKLWRLDKSAGVQRSTFQALVSAAATKAFISQGFPFWHTHDIHPPTTDKEPHFVPIVAYCIASAHRPASQQVIIFILLPISAVSLVEVKFAKKSLFSSNYGTVLVVCHERLQRVREFNWSVPVLTLLLLLHLLGCSWKKNRGDHFIYFLAHFCAAIAHLQSTLGGQVVVLVS